MSSREVDNADSKTSVRNITWFTCSAPRLSLSKRPLKIRFPTKYLRSICCFLDLSALGLQWSRKLVLYTNHLEICVTHTTFSLPASVDTASTCLFLPKHLLEPWEPTQSTYKTGMRVDFVPQNQHSPNQQSFKKTNKQKKPTMLLGPQRANPQFSSMVPHLVSVSQLSSLPCFTSPLNTASPECTQWSIP